MKKLVLLVAILALCVPSYGAVLVYKLAASYSPTFSFADANLVAAEVINKVKVDAFVVFDANLTSYDVKYLGDGDDANDPTAIIFTKIDKNKVMLTLGGDDPNSDVSIGNQDTSDTIKPFAVTNKKDTIASLLDVDITDYDNDLYLYDWSLYGKNTKEDIGLTVLGVKVKPLIAKSMKGPDEVYMNNDLFYGDGTAQLKLDSKYTKDANKGGWNVKQTVAKIQADLLNKKYLPIEVLNVLP
jgi:hypothetical protein